MREGTLGTAHNLMGFISRQAPTTREQILLKTIRLGITVIGATRTVRASPWVLEELLLMGT